MLATIPLPAGTDRVPIRDIPALIADALHPSNPVEDGGDLLQRMRWHSNIDDWEVFVRNAVNSGILIPRHPQSLLPQRQASGEWMFACFVTIDDLTQFLARFDIGVRFAEKAPAPTEKPAAEMNPGRTDWKAKARQIADECFEKDTKAGIRDSLVRKGKGGHITGGYAFRVMELMQKRGIHGPHGLINNPATIARDALQGDKWWANKDK
jgi:hypothetical protein